MPQFVIRLSLGHTGLRRRAMGDIVDFKKSDRLSFISQKVCHNFDWIVQMV